MVVNENGQAEGDPPFGGCAGQEAAVTRPPLIPGRIHWDLNGE